MGCSPNSYLPVLKLPQIKCKFQGPRLEDGTCKGTMTMNPEYCRSPRIVPATLSFNLRLSALAVTVGCVLIIGMMQPAQAQTFTVLHTFTGPDGLSPYSGVVMDRA